MKVLHLNYTDKVGGAAKAVFKLNNELRNLGINSQLLVRKKTIDNPIIIEYKSLFDKILKKYKPYLDFLPLYFYPKRERTYWNNGWFPTGIIKEIKKNDPDIVQLNWVSNGFISLKEIGKIEKPIVWRLSDSWAFTGGCHIPYQCLNYVEGCGKCPHLNSIKKKDLSFYILKSKIKHWNNLNITIIAPSKWMANCAANSSVFRNKKIVVIPTGIDIDVFKPMDKISLRKELNFSIEKKIVLFGAYSSTTDKNKGFEYLISALNCFSSEEKANIELLVFGNENDEKTIDLGFHITYLGYVENTNEMAKYYSLADLFVLPSLLENLSNAMIESFGCSTPVVAFNSGGNSDIIDHKINGYLAELHNYSDLKNGIEWILWNPEIETIRMNARNKVIEKFDIKKIAQDYEDIYKALCII